MPKLLFIQQIVEAYLPLVNGISVYKEHEFLKLYSDCINLILDYPGNNLDELKNKILVRSNDEKFSHLIVNLLYREACKSSKSTLLELKQRIESGFYCACKKSKLGRNAIGDRSRVSTTVRIDPDLKDRVVIV